jgi:hypothetical protein
MDNSIIEKIRKLLARADEARNDNEHEREIAMRQAHAMLAKHGLSMADVPEAEQAESEGALGRMSDDIGRAVWPAGVFDAIAKLNGCRVIRNPARNGKGASVWVIGRRVRCEITRDMARWLIKSIEREARKGGHKGTQFGTGAWYGIAEQVRRILANMQAGQVDGQTLAPGMALMVVNQHKNALVDAERAQKEFFPRTRTGGTQAALGGSSFHAGKSYGASVGLNGQVGRTSGSRLLT